MGCSPRGHKESDTTERLALSLLYFSAQGDGVVQVNCKSIL